MDQRGWGVYGDSVNSFVYNICSLPIKTIFNVHIDRDKDVGGEVIDLPAIKGSSKNEIQKKVWNYADDADTHTVETHIYRLRKKIKDKFSDDNFIINHKNGYLI